MGIKELEKQIAELKETCAKQDLRIRRAEGAREILNVLARYVNLHSASDQAATVKLFCRHTPGIRLIFNGHIYDGWEGVERHFIYRMANAEQDLSGRIYWHDIVSPLVEVAKDAMSAKVIVSTHGAETGWNKDGSLKSLWSWGRYRFDFLVEDGEWRIYRLEFHQCLNTPYEGKGWVEEPCYDLIGNAPEYLKKDPDPRTLPQRVTKKPYLSLRLDTPECDLHNLIPALPEPYKTYDFEGIKDEDDLGWHVDTESRV